EAKKGGKALESSYSQREIQDNPVNAAYEAATVGYEAAKEAKELTQGAVLDDTKEQLNTSLQLAKVAVDSAELALSYYQVTTPISGKVLGKNVEVNGMATSASPAYTIAGEDTMVVTFQVSESIMNTLQKNQKIKVERNGAEFDGVITEVGNAVNPQTGLFQIKAAVQANGQELPSGVSVKITSDTYTADNEIIIPYDAVYYETDGSYVYVVKDGRAVKTYVTAGIFDDSSIEIVEGISEGDVVITTWSPRLIDGVEVNANIK
ncbi:MAG: efflux RND transporter periplasmic adaptor subunit, partial [Acetatifactor sp.]|nr:efflux RND transporter periplasmic adaptor subunit [Acetatifactor sp.]